MYVASYRATERGAQHAIATKQRQEREAQTEARKEAEAIFRRKQELIKGHLEEFERQRQAAIEARLDFLKEQRAAGIRYRHTYARIEETACRVFRVSKQEIRSNRRSRPIVFARQFVMYWTARLTPHSLPVIGRLMGGRDHTTCLHGKRVYAEKRAKMGRHLRSVR